MERKRVEIHGYKCEANSIFQEQRRPFMKSYSVFFFITIAINASLSAAPEIQFDTKTHECGTLIEGKTEIVNAVFNVKNKGDAVLKITSVRPSCGCVAVRYDTAVQPGGIARIESFMNTRGFHSGPVAKWITVSSNAKNEPAVRLTIKAVYQARIDVLKKYLCFNESRNNKDTLCLATKKTDFKLLGAEFHSSGSASDNVDWQAKAPVAIGVTAISKDSTRGDGSMIYCFELVSPLVKRSQEGDVTITTNHPGKAGITLHATLLK
jgi:hypothetical protein